MISGLHGSRHWPPPHLPRSPPMLPLKLARNLPALRCSHCSLLCLWHASHGSLPHPSRAHSHGTCTVGSSWWPNPPPNPLLCFIILHNTSHYLLHIIFFLSLLPTPHLPPQWIVSSVRADIFGFFSDVSLTPRIALAYHRCSMLLESWMTISCYIHSPI